MRGWLVSILKLVVFLSFFSAIMVISHVEAQESKSDLCHFDSLSNSWVKINISERAVGDHLSRHDDCKPEEGGCVTEEGAQLDGDCLVVCPCFTSNLLVKLYNEHDLREFDDRNPCQFGDDAGGETFLKDNDTLPDGNDSSPFYLSFAESLAGGGECGSQVLNSNDDVVFMIFMENITPAAVNTCRKVIRTLNKVVCGK